MPLYNPKCVNDADLPSDGSTIKQILIHDEKCIIVRILRRIGYSWQRTGMDITIDLEGHTVSSEFAGMLEEWI